MKTYDVVVIGAGVLGSAIVWELQKKGYATSTVDLLPAPGTGSTSFSCGIVRCHYSTYPGVALSNESIRCWQNWADYLAVKDPRGIAEYRQCGVLFLLAPDWGVGADRVVELMDEVGVNMTRLSNEDLAEYCPYLNLAKKSPVRKSRDPAFFDEDPAVKIKGGIFENESGYVPDTVLASHNMFHAAEELGADGLFDRRVVEILRQGGRVSGVKLDNGDEIGAEVIVNATGPHSAHINRMAGVEIGLTLQAVRHEVHFLRCPDDIDLRKMPVYSDPDSGIYFRPDPPLGILLGSEDPPCDEPEIVDPDDFNTEITEEVYRDQTMRMKKRIPSLHIEGYGKEKAGGVGVGDLSYGKSGFGALYDVTAEDWYPILDKTDLPGYYMAVGTSGGWFKAAPLIGLLMAHLIEGVENGRDHDQSPVKVKLPFSGNEIDLGFFSRNRTPHKTSMTVIG